MKPKETLLVDVDPAVILVVAGETLEVIVPVVTLGIELATTFTE